jgi:hypothetical protein
MEFDYIVIESRIRMWWRAKGWRIAMMNQRGSEICTISFSLRSIITRFLLTLGFCIFFLISS